jgi:hypothetical protein
MGSNHSSALRSARLESIDAESIDLTGSRVYHLDSLGRYHVYVRISEDDRNDTEGVRRRLRELLRLSDEKGWTIFAVYVDNDLGASEFSTKPRPAYNEMVETVLARNAQCILTAEQARLTRNPYEFVAAALPGGEGRPGHGAGDARLRP